MVPAVAAKVAVTAPDATVTDAGTAKDVLVDDRATAAPPVGAVLESVTTQELDTLDARLVGVHCSDDRLTGAGACNEMVAVEEAPLSEAAMVAMELDEIVPLVAVKLADVEPAGTVTDGGTVRATLLE